MDLNDVIRISVDAGGGFLIDEQIVNIDMNPLFSASLEDAEKEKIDTWWSEKSTFTLIEAYRKYQELFKDPAIKKSNIWHEIANEVGICRTACQKKWGALLKTYRHKFYNTRTTKRNRWKYYQLLNEIVGDVMDENQISLAGSSSGFPFNDAKSPSHSEEESHLIKCKRKAFNHRTVHKSDLYLEENAKVRMEEIEVNKKLIKYLAQIINDTSTIVEDDWQEEQYERFSQFLDQDLQLRLEEINANKEFLKIIAKLVDV